ncbi:MAG TPA: bifunctional nuclease family protein [Streptosporangiaceae bacterium]|jgi:bifunctional DNase/RNase
MVAATEIGFVRMRVSKVVGLSDGDRFCEFMVLNELDGDRHLVIQIGSAEAFALAGGLGDVEWGRPMTYQFMAELVRSLGGRIRAIRLDALVSGAYAATVEAEGPHGVELVDARSSDALNLAVLVGAPIVVALEMVDDSDQRQEGDSAEAVLMRRALTAPPMTVKKAER